jgi:hypothetical protein
MLGARVKGATCATGKLPLFEGEGVAIKNTNSRGKIAGFYVGQPLLPLFTVTGIGMVYIGYTYRDV